MKPGIYSEIRAFLALSEFGTQAEAARQLGVSSATFGRSLLKLEKDLNQRLFHRGKSGLSLSLEGQELLARLRPLATEMAELESWLRQGTRKPQVKLSAGTWTSLFLANGFKTLCRSDDPFDLVFVPTEARLGIEHRQVDIGIRGARPEEGNLAAKRLGQIGFAPYAAKNVTDADSMGWLCLHPDYASTRSSRHVMANHSEAIAAYVTAPRLMLDFALQGVGKAVLPCFIGDAQEQLQRTGDEIEELREHQWLVMHGDGRFETHVRQVADRVADFYAARQGVLLGA
ncbi:LysR family transcriptional regulator [Pseudovibrio sp. SPO723]|uniref:LysR family transcriptional regulator n=1 Tax=Nesiotobacter zosterae TaxID=392721 RepID=UPI0029C4E079|nr:LysR family transcriptional regulator [Pseudovibrio sp. SPO723]MDX5595260.1 LysR family transcriptional regulator [Pseudovibrio sp. SPO723]